MRSCDEICRELLSRREDYRRVKRKKQKNVFVSAACLCLAAFIGIGLWKGGVFDGVKVLKESQKDSDTNTVSPPEVHYEGYAVSIPPIEIPQSEEGVSADMIGLVVYRGGIYTETSRYYGDDAQALYSLVGEYLGYATGTIDEWSSQDEYSREFASTCTGDVYSVNGYDTDFRICMCQNIEDSNGEQILWLQFYERLNGIGVTYGSDLFGDRLNMAGNWNEVLYNSHESWDNGVSAYMPLPGITENDIESFLSSLYSGEFEYVYDTDKNFYDSSKTQGHLFFTMNDGTKIELRLFEGGYVGYQDMGWYFVKMPGEDFDRIFDAIT